MGGRQAGGPAALAGHPVVGAWAWDNASERHPGARTYTAFHADGTLVDSHPLLGVGVGVWRATGARTLDLFVVYHHRDANGELEGLIASKGPAEVVGAGDGISFACAYEVKALDGTVKQAGTLTETGTRITVEGPGAHAPAP